MKGDSTIEEQLPPTQSIPIAKAPIKPAPVQPEPTPKPVIPTKPTVAKTAPLKPSTPGKPNPPVNPTPAAPITPPGEPKKSILSQAWFSVVMTIIIISLIAGILFLTIGNPSSSNDTSTPPTDGGQEGNQSQPITSDPGQDYKDLDIDVFTCEEIVKMNKEIIDSSCTKEAVFEVVVGIDYINTVYADSEEDACINGPQNLIDYVRSNCGSASADEIENMTIIEPVAIDLINTSNSSDI